MCCDNMKRTLQQGHMQWWEAIWWKEGCWWKGHQIPSAGYGSWISFDKLATKATGDWNSKGWYSAPTSRDLNPSSLESFRVSCLRTSYTRWFQARRYTSSSKIGNNATRTRLHVSCMGRDSYSRIQHTDWQQRGSIRYALTNGGWD